MSTKESPSKLTAEEEHERLEGKVENRSITEEMRTAYLDYAMSVIVSRALPDVRDGLKPVHRRILYSMWSSGLRSSAKFKKCATVVGDVLGKYHPHGDSAVYDSLVRMAQDFSLRYPLIRGQGNFGSLDGDSAAAYRYTESKLESISEEMLLDIEKETVRFAPNYDGSHDEPTVLPARLPNLLLNGTLGIAVGMATNIPPHNLTEICDGISALIENPDISIEELCHYITGPDFPTGGIIYNVADIRTAYETGRGGIVMRAKADIEEIKSGMFRIIVSEIPYQVNKATMLGQIATLVTDKKLDGIRDLRDESNKEGIRVVIELKKDAFPKKVLNQLFKMTQLQETFHVNMLAIVDGIQPRVLNIKMILEEYIKHRQEIVRRRTEYDLAKAKERAHILEGLRIALANIDEIIKTIKKSKDKDEAKVNLIKKFKLTEIQSFAILEMRLQQLANLERLKIEQEYKEKMDLIKELESILKSAKKMLQIIKDEVSALKEKYGDDRRTKVIKTPLGEFAVEDFIPQEPTIVMITEDGYVKRLSPDTFRQQKRGGKGVVGLGRKEEDEVRNLFSTDTHADLLFFTSRGRVFRLKAYEVPEASRTAKGQAIQNFLQLSPGETVSSVLPLPKVARGKVREGIANLVMTTVQGTIKKVPIGDFDNIRRSGLIAIKIKEGDELRWVIPSSGKDDVSLVTASGQSIRFSEKNVRAMGRVAAGVRGIKFKKNDAVVGMDVIDSEKAKSGELELFTIAENGLGKRTNLKQFKIQGRGGSGVRAMHVSEKTGPVIGAFISTKNDDRDLILISQNGIVLRVPFKGVPSLGRDTQGVRVMRFKQAGDKVSSVAFVTTESEDKA